MKYQDMYAYTKTSDFKKVAKRIAACIVNEMRITEIYNAHDHCDNVLHALKTLVSSELVKLNKGDKKCK